MELLLTIALIIAVVLLFMIRSGLKESERSNKEMFNLLRRDIRELKEQLSREQLSKQEKTAATSTPSSTTTEDPVVQWRPAVPGKITRTDPPEIKETAWKKEEKMPVQEVPEKKAPQEKTQTPTPVLTPVRPPEPSESWWSRWLQNNPDLEKFVGENLANKIGIAVLVLGIAFFVKYAIDKDWINETGRVCIGIGCGILLTGIAHYLRNTYRSFSSVLAGGAIAVYYFTIAFAFHQYNMFSQTTAFIIMVGITAFAATLSLLYNKLELAIIAVVGGFLVPFMVSRGEGNYIVLFTYLAILNTGILSISYFKKWPSLHVLAFFFTQLIFAGWLAEKIIFSQQVIVYQNALLFASCFYVLFMAIAMIHNLRKQNAFGAFDFSFLLLITFSFYAEGMLILGDWNNGTYQGLFTIVMSVINLALAWYLYKSHKGDKNLLYLLIGLTLTFLSLAAPVQLHGHSITMFWSAEMVLLYWLHQRSGISIFKYSSAIVMLLMMVSLLMDWAFANDAAGTYLPLIFNSWQGVVTNMVAVFSFAGYAWLLWKSVANERYVLGIINLSAATVMMVIAVLILYFTCIFGINWHYEILSSSVVPNVYHQLTTYIFIAVILQLNKRMKRINNQGIPYALTLLAFVVYFMSAGLGDRLLTGVLNRTVLVKHLYMHWLAAALLLYIQYEAIKILKNNQERFHHGFVWLINLILLVIFGVECRLLYIFLLANANTISVYNGQYMKAGLTIVCALYSFVIMWLGMRNKFKTLRIISLSFFTAALLKLFLYDISNISEGGKIAAFIMLGILLLIISFMYQRLKKIVFSNEENNTQ